MKKRIAYRLSNRNNLMDTSTIIVVQTKDRDILHSLAARLQFGTINVTKYWSENGSGIPQLHISVGDEVYIVPVAIYGYLMNTEGVKLPCYSSIKDMGIIPERYKHVQLQQTLNYKTVEYLKA